jgi:hypothetical protein
MNFLETGSSKTRYLGGSQGSVPSMVTGSGLGKEVFVSRGFELQNKLLIPICIMLFSTDHRSLQETLGDLPESLQLL